MGKLATNVTKFPKKATVEAPAVQKPSKKPEKVSFIKSLFIAQDDAPQTREHGILDQMRIAFAPKNRLAGFVGLILGGFVPIDCYFTAHHQLDARGNMMGQFAFYVVVACLVFSAKTVYDWALQACNMRAKAFGLVVILEGTMVGSWLLPLRLAALIILVMVNAIGTAYVLARFGRGEPIAKT